LVPSRDDVLPVRARGTSATLALGRGGTMRLIHDRDERGRLQERLVGGTQESPGEPLPVPILTIDLTREQEGPSAPAARKERP
jgi:hypothetical protein